MLPAEKVCKQALDTYIMWKKKKLMFFAVMTAVGNGTPMRVIDL